MKRRILLTVALVLATDVGVYAQGVISNDVPSKQHSEKLPAQEQESQTPKEIARLLEVLQSTQAEAKLAASRGTFQDKLDYASKVTGDITWATQDVRQQGLTEQAQVAVLGFMQAREKSATGADVTAVRKGLQALTWLTPLSAAGRQCLTRLTKHADAAIRKQANDLLTK